MMWFSSLQYWRERVHNLFLKIHIVGLIFALVAVWSFFSYEERCNPINSFASRSSHTSTNPRYFPTPLPVQAFMSLITSCASSDLASQQLSSVLYPNLIRPGLRFPHTTSVGVLVNTFVFVSSPWAWVGSDGRRFTRSLFLV